jgi:predicted phage terminase large subunit-like protein
VILLIEDKASGQSLIQVLDQETRIPVSPITPEGNKKVRAEEVSNVVEGGRVWLPEEAPWLIKYETNMAQFPLGKEDDDVDSTTQFLRWASKPRYKRRKMRFWK